MRIALVLPVYWPAVGGCELHTRELAQRLAARHDVSIITLLNSEEDKLAHELWLAAILRAPPAHAVSRDGGIAVTRLGMRAVLKPFYAALARVQSPKLPAALVRLAMAALAARFRRCLEPLLREVDVVHCVHGGVSYLGYAALLAARRVRRPFVYTPLMHLQDWGGDEAGSAPAKPRLVPRTWTDPHWKKIWQAADAVLTMTDYEREHYIREGVPASRIITTGVGPMLSPQRAQPAPRGGATGPTVLFLARNTPAKGIGEVLGAAPLVWKEMPAARFVIAGPRTPETDRLVGNALDSRMEVLGGVSDERKDELLAGCTVFCMPSREESLGATYLEAWAHGKPIVGLRIPPLEELTGRERGGLLARPTPQDVAEKILILLRDPARARQMGEWGRRRVEERYAWRVLVARTEAVYATLLDAPERSREQVTRPVPS